MTDSIGPHAGTWLPASQPVAEAPPVGSPTWRVRGLRWVKLIRPILARMIRKAFADRILGLSAEAGFWALLSLPSLALAVFGSLGYLRGILGDSAVRQIHDDVLRAARDILTPSTVNSDVAPLVNQVLQNGQVGVISLGFVISLWSGSTAMSDYVNTITVAYDMRGLRGSVRSRMLAVWLYICFVVVGTVLLPVLALGPGTIVDLAPSKVQGSVDLVVHILYWPVAAALSVVLLASLYKLSLPVRVRWRRGLPGATLAMGLWLVGSFAVRAYLTSSFRGKAGYGSLGAPIAALLFFYVTALAVLLGAELNSAIDSVSPVASTVEGRARSRRKAAEAEARRAQQDEHGDREIGG